MIWSDGHMILDHEILSFLFPEYCSVISIIWYYLLNQNVTVSCWRFMQKKNYKTEKRLQLDLV